MAVASTTTQSRAAAAARRTLGANDAEETNQTEAQLSENEVPAKVIEKQKTLQGERIIEYDTTVSPKSADLETEEYDGIPEFENLPVIEQMPVSPLARMFEDLRSVQAYENQGFIVAATRKIDFAGDNFFHPCMGADIILPAFRIMAQDMFNFVPAIQKHNNNSGGRFSVALFYEDGKPVEVKRYGLGVHGRSVAMPQQVGIAVFVVQNPIREELNGNNPENSTLTLMREMQRKQEEQQNKFIEAMREQRQPSAIEKAMEQKILHDMLNPPTNNNDNQQAVTQMMVNTFGQMFAMPAMISKMTEQMWPTQPQPEQPSVIDHMNKALQIPVVENVVNGLLNIGESFAVRKLQGSATDVTNNAEETVDVQAQEMTEADELTAAIIDELESDRPLDNTNTLLGDLQREYPDQFNELLTYCEAPYSVVQKVVIQRLNKQATAHILRQFLDVSGSQQSGRFIFNERGQAMLTRLEKLYNFLNSLTQTPQAEETV